MLHREASKNPSQRDRVLHAGIGGPGYENSTAWHQPVISRRRKITLQKAHSSFCVHGSKRNGQNNRMCSFRNGHAAVIRTVSCRVGWVEWSRLYFKNAFPQPDLPHTSTCCCFISLAPPPPCCKINNLVRNSSTKMTTRTNHTWDEFSFPTAQKRGLCGKEINLNRNIQPFHVHTYPLTHPQTEPTEPCQATQQVIVG